MSNYIKATDFATKDSLITGDPLKIVSGTEINDEYNAIQTAVNSKADLNSPTLTGVPRAPTASSGTSTTQIATTAFVKSADDALLVDTELTGTPTAPTATSATDTTQIATTEFVQEVISATKEALYPVGSIYTNATNNTNPATLLGFGTWTAFGAGRVPVGFDASDANFNSAQKTGGSKTETLSEAQLPNITGRINTTTQGSGGVISSASGVFTAVDSTNIAASADAGFSLFKDVTMSFGSGQSHNNLQPYITVYMWKRTA